MIIENQIKSNEYDYYNNINDSTKVDKRLTYRDQSERIEKKNSSIKLSKIPETSEKEKSFMTLDSERKIKTIDFSQQNLMHNNDLIQNTQSYNSASAYGEINNLSTIQLQRNAPLKTEIDYLDLEIQQLQDKLKFMINDKK